MLDTINHCVGRSSQQPRFNSSDSKTATKSPGSTSFNIVFKLRLRVSVLLSLFSSWNVLVLRFSPQKVLSCLRSFWLKLRKISLQELRELRSILYSERSNSSIVPSRFLDLNSGYVVDGVYFYTLEVYNTAIQQKEFYSGEIHVFSE